MSRAGMTPLPDLVPPELMLALHIVCFTTFSTPIRTRCAQFRLLRYTFTIRQSTVITPGSGPRSGSFLDSDQSHACTSSFPYGLKQLEGSAAIGPADYKVPPCPAPPAKAYRLRPAPHCNDRCPLSGHTGSQSHNSRSHPATALAMPCSIGC